MSEFSTKNQDFQDGRAYWRSLDELADTDAFRTQLENEFPSGIDAPSGMSRRRFLQVMSASIAMVSLAGCRWPKEDILPYAARPEGMTPGTPLKFATTMELGPVAHSVLATSFDGRPIKIDGNPDAELSGGASDAFAQASVLDLYDPDRGRHVISREGGSTRRRSWKDFEAFAAKRFAGGLEGVAILSEASTSPSLWGLLGQAIQKGARCYGWEPVCRDQEIMGAAAAFGVPAKTLLDLEQARVIVDFEANLLQDHPTALRNNRQFAAGRQAESGHMNRLYCYENSFTTTGGAADHRFPTASSEIGAAVWALAAELVLGEGLPLPDGAGFRRADLKPFRGHAAGSEHVAAVAKDLMAHRGHGLLVAGMRQPAEVHHMVHVLNAALGNVGHAVSYLPMDLPPVGNLKDLVADLNAGKVRTLLILGGNPVYDAPADLEFAKALGKAGVAIHLAHGEDATSRKCAWHLPKTHYLESWGDAIAWDGTHLSVQPLIEPLFGARSSIEVLSLILEKEPRSGYAIVRDTFAGGRAPEADSGFEDRWRDYLNAGFLAGSGQARGRALALSGRAVKVPHSAALSAQNLELSFALDQSVFDGRFANNAWLQEVPDFMTKLTWDNAALVSPGAAQELGIGQGEF
ncbi:molybdopterin oxidoreductase, partial [bacterium DOLZORAL124_64_63]